MPDQAKKTPPRNAAEGVERAGSDSEGGYSQNGAPPPQIAPEYVFNRPRPLFDFREPLKVPVPRDFYDAWLALPLPSWEPVVAAMRYDYNPGCWPMAFLELRNGHKLAIKATRIYVDDARGELAIQAPLPSLAPECATPRNAWKLQPVWAFRNVPGGSGPDYAELVIQGRRLVQISDEGILVWDSPEDLSVAGAVPIANLLFSDTNGEGLV